MKKWIKGMAFVLSAVLLIQNMGQFSPALASNKIPKEIVEFEELPEDVLYQEVEYGTRKKDLELPSSLKAWVLEMDAATQSSANEEENEEKKVNVKVKWVLDESFSQQDRYDGEVPGIYVYEASLRNEDDYILSADLPTIEVVVLEGDDYKTASPSDGKTASQSNGMMKANVKRAPKDSGYELTGENEYSVSSLDGLNAVYGLIEQSAKDEFTIIFVNSIRGKDSVLIEGDITIGVEGKQITYQSDDDDNVIWNTAGFGAANPTSLYLNGDCILDGRIFLNTFRNVYANGHKFEITAKENPQNLAMYFYGSGESGDVDQVDLTLRGDGEYDGCWAEYVYACAPGCGVTGNVNITIDDYTIRYAVIGGSRADSQTGEIGRIGGDININVLSGNIGTVGSSTRGIYGGSIGYTKDGKIIQGIVDGDIKIILGEEGAEINSAETEHIYGGGELCSSNSVEVLLLDGGYCDRFLYAAGQSTTINKYVHTTLEGNAYAETLYCSGTALTDPLTIGSLSTKDQTVVKATLDIDTESRGAQTIIVGPRTTGSNNHSNINGNCLLELKAGTITAMGRNDGIVFLPDTQNTINGGMTAIIEDILFRYIGSPIVGITDGTLEDIKKCVKDDVNVIFNHCGEFGSDINNGSSLFGSVSIEHIENVVLDNSCVYSEYAEFLKDVDNLELKGNSILVLKGPMTLNENLILDPASVLGLSRVDETDDQGLTGPATISVGNKISGKATLYTVVPYEKAVYGPPDYSQVLLEKSDITFTPAKDGEIYLMSNDVDGETADSGTKSNMFTLGNGDQKTYVEYISGTVLPEPGYDHIWRIHAPEKIELTFAIRAEDSQKGISFQPDHTGADSETIILSEDHTKLTHILTKEDSSYPVAPAQNALNIPDGIMIAFDHWALNEKAYDLDGIVPADAQSVTYTAVFSEDKNSDGFPDQGFHDATLKPYKTSIYTGGSQADGFPELALRYEQEKRPVDDSVITAIVIDGKRYESEAGSFLTSSFFDAVYWQDGDFAAVPNDQEGGIYNATVVFKNAAKDSIAGSIEGGDGMLRDQQGKRISAAGHTIVIEAHYPEQPETTVFYNITIEPETLIIRYVNEDDIYRHVASNENELTLDGTHAAAVVPADSQLLVNGVSERPISRENADIRLLSDDVLDLADNRKQLLLNKGFTSVAGLSANEAQMQGYHSVLRYFDLVDYNNGNAWISSSKGVDVYLPYPEGTNSSTEFTLLHFEGLHRENYYGDIAEAIQTAPAISLAYEPQENALVFHVDESGFSPFMLIWKDVPEAPKPEPDPEPKPEPNPDDEQEGGQTEPEKPDTEQPSDDQTSNNTGSSGHGSSGDTGSGSPGAGPGASGSTYTAGVNGNWVHMDPEDVNSPISDPVPENATPVTNPEWHQWKFVLNNGLMLYDQWAYVRNPYAVGDQPKEGWFSFNHDGIMNYGWYLDEETGKWYWLHRESDGMLGTMETGWHYDDQDGKWYYLDPESGAMLLGWQLIDGNWYYFNPTPAAQTWNYHVSSGGWTYNGSIQRPLGSMYINELTPDGYTVGSDGVWRR